MVFVDVPSRRTTAVVPRLAAQIKGLREHLSRSMTCDLETEIMHHERFMIDTYALEYFFDPRSTW
jgi:IS30 family transposase